MCIRDSTKEIKDSIAKVNAARLKFKMDSIAAAKAETDKNNKLKADRNKWKADSVAKVNAIIKEENDKLNKAKADANASIVFKVQFASSDTPLDLKEKRFANIKNGSYYKVKTTYKYTSGNFPTMNEASTHQALLRENGFKDCFVVAFKNGERIDVNEAKRLLEKKE